MREYAGAVRAGDKRSRSARSMRAVLAWAVALVMALSLLPAPAFAEAAASLQAGSVAVPMAAKSVVYDGAEQQGVPEGEGYGLSGATAKDAGDYTATATLKDGYTWADGGTSAKQVVWSIQKAVLHVAAPDRAITQGEGLSSVEAQVTGFVGGESAASAAGYEAPEVQVLGSDGSVVPPSQVASLSAGTYTLAVSGGAAKNYKFVYQSGTLVVKPASASDGNGDNGNASGLAAGTYTVTANLAMPGLYNPVISGLTVYANNPNNPFGPTIDENDASEVADKVPSDPQSMNAQLIVQADGTRTLVLPVKNPIFTLQSLGTCADLSNVRVERVAPTAGGGSYSGSYGNRADRIHMVAVDLPSSAANEGTLTYNFKGSVLYAVPLDLELAPSGDIALQLTVDMDSLQKASDSTALPAFAQSGSDNGNTGTNGNGNSGADNGNGSNSSNNGSTVNNGSGDNGSTGGTNGSSVANAVSNAKSTAGANATGSAAGDTIQLQDGHLAAGSYTVSANIWVDKEKAGLPLAPHFTNGAFPPSYSVTKNATLTVDSNGRASVRVPLIIQDRVMKVNSISGLDLLSSSRNSAGGLSSITVDLGKLSNTNTITKPATASITLGSLASTIIGAPYDRTWSVTFEVVFGSNVTQTGGKLPAAAQAIINGQGSDGLQTDAQANADSAAADALAALDAAEEADAAELGSDGTGQGGSNDARAAAGGTGNVLEDAAEAAQQNPWLAVLVVALIAAAAACGFLAGKKRGALKPAAAQAQASAPGEADTPSGSEDLTQPIAK